MNIKIDRADFSLLNCSREWCVLKKYLLLEIFFLTFIQKLFIVVSTNFRYLKINQSDIFLTL